MNVHKLCDGALKLLYWGALKAFLCGDGLTKHESEAPECNRSKNSHHLATLGKTTSKNSFRAFISGDESQEVSSRKALCF